MRRAVSGRCAVGKSVFIVGTDTDVGKTYVTGLIVKKLRESGATAAYFKAAMSGNARDGEGKLIPGDALAVKRMSGISQPLEKMCPYVYEQAVSPHLAARWEDRPVCLSRILAEFQALCAAYEYVTMEGAGGILCPMRFDGGEETGPGSAGEELWLPQVIKACGAGCLLVADAGLGVINHVGLTAFYMKERGIDLRGIIFNHYRPGDRMQEDNLRMCEHLTGVPVVACVEDGCKDLEISCERLKALYHE